MELEVVRACAAAAADVTIGLGAQIDGLTMDKVGDLKPSLRAIYNYVDHPFVARKTVNVEEADSGAILFPCLAIYLDSAPAIDAEVMTIYRDGTYPVAFSYLSTEKEDAKRMRDALYVNRALLRFLTQFNSNANQPMRQRNGVYLYSAAGADGRTPIAQYTPTDKWEMAYLAASTVVTYRCREHQP